MTQLALPDLAGVDRRCDRQPAVRHTTSPWRSMSRYQIALLRRFKRGERLESARAFPGPRTVRAVTPNGRTDRASEIVLGNLIRKGLLVPAPADPQWDRITYRLTPAGRALVDRMRSLV